MPMMQEGRVLPGRQSQQAAFGQKQPLRAGQKRTSDKTPIRLKYNPK